MKLITRGARAFGHFWWDFLIGDAPELFVATLVIVGVALLLRHDHTVAYVVLPVLAVAFLVASTVRAGQRSRRPPEGP
jgi:hypothetical protein